MRADGTRTGIVLRGETGCTTRPVLSGVLSRVIASYVGDVVIDLTELEFIDTATARVLAMAHPLLGRRGRKLSFLSPSRLVAPVLELFGLSDLIEGTERSRP